MIPLFFSCLLIVSIFPNLILPTATEDTRDLEEMPTAPKFLNEEPVPCQCGIFLSDQFKSRKEEPKGNPALMEESDEMYSCNLAGEKLCMRRCLETIMAHLPHSATIICSTIDRDIYKARAYLYVKNCKNTWATTNLSAGREFCCKDGVSFKCI